MSVVVTTPPATEPTTPPATPPAAPPATEPTTPPTTPPAAPAGSTFTQAQVDELIGKRLEEDRTRRQREEEEAAAVKAGDLQKVIDARDKRIGELEPLVDQLKTANERVSHLEAVLDTQVKALREGLPEHIVPLLDNMAVDKQLEYLAKNRDALVGTPATPPSRPRGTPPATPPATTPPSKDEAMRAELAALRSSGDYSG